MITTKQKQTIRNWLAEGTTSEKLELIDELKALLKEETNNLFVATYKALPTSAKSGFLRFND